MRAWRAAAAIFASSSAEQPVVPMTWTMRACAARPANSTVAAGAVKSSTPSALAKAGERIVGDRHADRRRGRPVRRRPCRARASRRARRRRRCARPRHRVDGADQRLPHAAGGPTTTSSMSLMSLPSLRRAASRSFRLSSTGQAACVLQIGGSERRGRRVGQQARHACLPRPPCRARMHDDLVGVDDGREPVGDDDDGAAAHRVLERLLHAGFRFVVERRGRLVEQQDRRVAHERAGDRERAGAGRRRGWRRSRRPACRSLAAAARMNSCGDRPAAPPPRSRRRSRPAGRSGCCRGSCLRTDRAAARHRRCCLRSDCLVTSAMSCPSIRICPPSRS